MADLFFWTSKLFWLLVTPGSLLVWLALAAWLAGRTRWQATARVLWSTLVIFIVALAFLPVGHWLLYPLEQRFPTLDEPASAPDGIILLGGSIAPALSSSRNQPHFTGTSERLVAFLQLANRYPQSRLIFTGGSGNLFQQEFREADIARRLFNGLGLDESRVRYERDSRNTWENARNSRELLQPSGEETWLLITSAHHMPRAMGVFCRLGWSVTPYPVDYRTETDNLLRVELNFSDHLMALESALREWIGLLSYRLTGRTGSLLPGPDTPC